MLNSLRDEVANILHFIANLFSTQSHSLTEPKEQEPKGVSKIVDGDHVDSGDLEKIFKIGALTGRERKLRRPL